MLRNRQSPIYHLDTAKNPTYTGYGTRDADYGKQAAFDFAFYSWLAATGRMPAPNVLPGAVTTKRLEAEFKAHVRAQARAQARAQEGR